MVGTGSAPLGDFDLDESPDAPPVGEQIVGALRSNHGKVIDLFRSWDDNGNGTVTREEFHKAMSALGLEVPRATIDEIFTGWDRDGGGELALQELDRILRGAATTSLSIEKLRRALARKGVMVTTLIRECDKNGDGALGKTELYHAIKSVGLDLSRDLIDAIFERLDKDRGGTITLRELNSALRKDQKAEAARKAREAEEAEQKAREEAAIAIVDVNSLRASVTKKLRGDVARGRPAQPQTAEGEADSESASSRPQTVGTGTELGVLHQSARDKALQRMRLHTRLRLRGTDAISSTEPFCDTRPINGARVAVTRHAQRPLLRSATHPNKPPRLIDVLSAHRVRSHPPARKNCDLFFPPAPPRLSRRRLTELRLSSSEKTIKRQMMGHAKLATQSAAALSLHTSRSTPALKPLAQAPPVPPLALMMREAEGRA
jgi:Ca2+-binding EF-hand superfamily protein